MAFQRFIRDRRASVVPIFALSVIPLTGLVGAAVDYSRAASARSSMQAAVDSTALALSKSASTLSSAAIQSQAQTIFNAVFTRAAEVPSVAVSTVYTTGNGSQLVVNATGSIKTTFMGLMGFSDLTVAASATSVWGNTRLRVALVLDNTGSMADSGKITALKTASHNLIAQLKNAARVPEDVYVAIIPYGKDVNVKSGTTVPDWVDFTIWDTLNGTCTKSGSKQSTCTANGGTWTPKAHSTWNGCVMDRDQNWDVSNAAPDNSTKFPAEQYSYCAASIMPLTNDWTALDTKVDAMTPNGSTNNTIGLVWGWQALSTTAPLSAPAKDPNYQYQDVIVLLTDGLNTQNRWSGDGANHSTAVDTRTEKACTNVKAANITIYTVLVMDGNASLLQSCASDTNHYFYLTASNQIITTFDTIGTQLSKLRLAK